MSDATRKIGPGVPPLRPPNPNKGKRKKGEKGAYNRARRGREWLEEEEVRQLRAAAAKLGRHGHRDSTMILMGYRHGLRVTELVNLSWDVVNMNQHEVFIRRVKGSKLTMHTMQRDEMTALRKLGPNRSGLVFRSERGKGPVSERSFYAIIARAGKEAGLGFPVHPHMLRHACGYYMGNQDPPIPTRVIQEWLGHVSIEHTVQYTDLNPDVFRRLNIWGKAK